MTCLEYKQNELFIENVSLKSIAEQFGTPCYIYSQQAIVSNWQRFTAAFDKIPRHICYAVKANSNLHILKLLVRLHAGFDIVSGGELHRVLAAGGEPNSIIFSGVGKLESEIKHAAEIGIRCFNVESIAELERIQKIARALSKRIPIAFRINPNVDPKTHAHISTGLNSNKFGIEPEEVLKVAMQLLNSSEVQLIGIATHIGSQITELHPFLIAMERMQIIYDKLLQMGHPLKYLDMGGGLGITYYHETPPTVQAYADSLQAKMKRWNAELILEPGRVIVGNAGVLLTQIQYIKHTAEKRFAIIDAGMNDLLRPVLYDAWQTIMPVHQRQSEKLTYDIAGPVCESADYLGKSRELAIKEGDYLVVDSAGAYGFSMSSNYNSRPRAAEVLVHGSECKLIRRRETFADLIAAEEMALLVTS